MDRDRPLRWPKRLLPLPAIVAAAGMDAESDKDEAEATAAAVGRRWLAGRRVTARLTLSGGE
jgi:hypothetical protein